MKLKNILELVNAQELTICDPEILDYDFKYVFATDLMSDALAMLHKHQEDTLLLTGLINQQAIRTAEMLDVSTLIFVRDKTVSDDVIELAKENKMNIFNSKMTMYEACGILYKEGLDSPCKETL